MKKNKGYTLVELLVVIAIMAILSGLAVVSIGLIYKAKIKDGMQVFNSQLSNTWLRTKSTASGAKSMYAEMEWSKNGFTYRIVDSSGEKSNTTLKKWSNAVEWKNLKISYTPESESQKMNGYGNDEKKWYIQFDKATGAVIKGAGTYEFINSQGTVAGTIYLDATTGNHYSVVKDGSGSSSSSSVSASYSVSKK